MHRLPDPEHALAVASLDDRHACKERVLSALEDIMQFDDDEALRCLVRRRYNDLRKGRHPA